MSLVSAHPRRGELVRRLVPSLTVFFAILLMALPLPLAWGVMPHLALLLVVIWASIQPRLMPVWGAFLLGLAADLLFGAPLGIWALLFPVAVAAVRLAEARVEGHSLALDWAFAGLISGLALLFAWQALHFLGSRPPAWPFAAQALATLLAYPPVAAVAARVQRRLVAIDG